MYYTNPDWPRNRKTAAVYRGKGVETPDIRAYLSKSAVSARLHRQVHRRAYTYHRVEAMRPQISDVTAWYLEQAAMDISNPRVAGLSMDTDEQIQAVVEDWAKTKKRWARLKNKQEGVMGSNVSWEPPWDEDDTPWSRLETQDGRGD